MSELGVVICASVNQCAVGSALEHGLAGSDADLHDVATVLQAAGTRDGARTALAGLAEAHASLGTWRSAALRPSAA